MRRWWFAALLLTATTTTACSDDDVLSDPGAGGGPSGGAAGSGGSVATGGAGGAACNVATKCWNPVQITKGTLNKVFVDGGGKLYVGVLGSGPQYITNASGAWVTKPLNAQAWAIDASGRPHTVVKGQASESSAGLSYSTLVDGNWTSEALPPVDVPCSDASVVKVLGWDISVSAGGTPHIAWLRWFSCSPSGTGLSVVRSIRSGSQWISEIVGASDNGQEAHVAGTVDAQGHFHQAWMSFRRPSYDNTAGLPSGDLFVDGEAYGQIVLAKAATLPIFALFSASYFDGDSLTSHVILTRDVASPPQPQAATMLLSCAGDGAEKHSLAVTPSGTIHAAWISKSGEALLASNTGAGWDYASLGPAADVALALVSGDLQIFLQRGSAIVQVTPC